MKYVLLLAVGLAALGLVASPADSKVISNGVGAAYAEMGPVGMLEIVADPGLPYAAWNVNGALVACGVLEARYTATYVPVEPGTNGCPLNLVVGDEMLLVISDDNGWVFE
ncbi:MAG: hypothetical protein AB7T63_10065 [Planctomycetota bacterium]